MIGWWFGEYMRTTAHYQRWHPRDHVWMSWEDKQPIDLGRMVHLALPRAWGCELHSRFWLGYVRSRSGSRLVDGLGNLPWARRLRARSSFGRALLAHCHEEMTTLAGFLPGLHASESRP